MMEVQPCKPIPMTPSGLDMFTLCPFRFYAKYVTKQYEEITSPAATLGTEVHKAIEDVIQNNRATIPTEIPIKFHSWIRSVQHAVDSDQATAVAEQRFAVDKNFSPVGWKDKSAILRNISDVTLVYKNTDVVVNIDWKTGKVRDGGWQQAITALTSTAYANKSMANNYWVYGNFGVVKASTYNRNHMGQFDPLFVELKEYYSACSTGVFPMRRNGLCRKWCGNLACVHNGK